MSEAVVIATARTPIGRARKGTLAGSGCSLGRPIAATGARMVVTMVHELRRRGKSLGVVSMCAGGGMGSAMIIEVL
jgi:acetyl-CoA acetyltransferase